MVKTVKGRGKMVKKRAAKKKGSSKAAVRASISFPPDMYETLESVAREKKVSLAWVVREAAEQYIGSKWPLLFKRKKAGGLRT